MPHEINRLLRAFSATPWFIDPRAAERIVAVLMVRAVNGPRGERFRAESADRPPARERRSNIVVLNLHGPILPRSNVDDISSPPNVGLDQFSVAFDQAAADSAVGAIVLNIDSPGGVIDMVPEMAAKVFAARDPSRPIIAVANTVAASAAYWIASAADELVVTDSGEVGSIGVWSMHEDVSEALAADGVKITLISEGARKAEGNPFQPLDDVARAHLQSVTRYHYDQLVTDVARFRGVDEAIVRADPEEGGPHFGGGRTYPARTAVRLGMADRVETLESVLRSLQTGKRPIRNQKRSSAQALRRRLALI